MNPVRAIIDKRNGRELSPATIEQFMGAYVRGEIPDYQMAALAMAVFFQGMTIAETVALTQSMLASGRTLAWDAGPAVVDKHSTGGIGDKTSLILAPLLACCELRVPMLSGRGLGVTGGTLDKLESIAEFRTQLAEEEIARIVAECGCVIAGTTERIVPADRRLYALRDVTGTVPSIPLIAASIMSKKLAEGLQALVLDVKWGSGAFMKDVTQASELAAVMVGIGRSMGVATAALVTDMNQPLGRKAGNALEVEEAVQTLQGQGPEDLVEVTLALACELLTATGVERDAPTAERRLRELLASGAAYEQFARMVRAQGGDLDALRPMAPRYELRSAAAGYVGSIDGEELGWALIEMGAGRRHKEDPLDLSTGLEMHVRSGDRVDVGQPLATLYVACDGPRPCDPALPLRMVADAIRVVDEPPAPLPLVVRRVDGSEVDGSEFEEESPV